MLCLVSKGTFVSRMSSPSKDNLKCCRLLRPTLSTCVLWNNHPQEVGISKGRPSPRQGPVKVVIFLEMATSTLCSVLFGAWQT